MGKRHATEVAPLDRDKYRIRRLKNWLEGPRKTRGCGKPHLQAQGREFLKDKVHLPHILENVETA